MDRPFKDVIDSPVLIEGIFRMGVDLEHTTLTAEDALKQVIEANKEIAKAFIELAKKQERLLSGENIRTINGESILGSGDLQVGGSGGGGIPEAPIDGNLYGRKDKHWEQVPDPTLPDAPKDYKQYGRFNGAWTEIVNTHAFAEKGGYTGTPQELQADLASIQGLYYLLQGV